MAMQHSTNRQTAMDSPTDEKRGVGGTRHFPWKLHFLLEQVEETGTHASIIAWLPGGRSFKVHQKDKFAIIVLPAFFNTTKYKSFQRSLNLWGFETVSKGPSKGVCSHPLFVRGQPSLCHQMSRVIVKGYAAARSRIPAIHNTEVVQTETPACALPTPSMEQPPTTASAPFSSSNSSAPFSSSNSSLTFLQQHMRMPVPPTLPGDMSTTVLTAQLIQGILRNQEEQALQQYIAQQQHQGRAAMLNANVLIDAVARQIVLAQQRGPAQKEFLS
jgi:hypothetical protein